MKIFIILIVCVWMFNIQRVVCYSDLNEELNDYLQNKSTALHDTFSRKRHQLSKRGDNGVEFEEIRNVTYDGKIGDVKVVTFFEEKYLLVGKELMSISSKPNEKSMVNLHQDLERIPDDQRVIFAKTIVYNSSPITLSRLELGEAHIYGFKNDSHFFIQTLLIPYSSDAHFFIYNDNLYLIVVNNRGDNLAPTIIYKWLGSHFDEIQTIFTIGAIKVASFSTNTSEIIIILQHLPKRMIFSEIYEFRKDKIKKIQYFRADNPINVVTYISKHKRYAIVFEQSRKNTVHIWNGFQLADVNEFESEDVITISGIYTTNGSSVLIVPSYNKVQVHRLSSEKIKLEGEKQFPSNYSALLDMHCLEIEENITTMIVGITEDDRINLNILPFKINFRETEYTPEDKNILRECFNDLEQKVYTWRNKINVTKSKIQLITDDTDSENKQDLSTAILSENLKKETGIEKDLSDIKSRLKSVNSFLNNYTFPHAKTMIVNGSLILEGSAKSDELTGKNIKIKSANARKWVPEQWLKYEEPQTITGPVKIKSVITKILETSSDDPLVKDILLKAGNQTITGYVSIGNLTANKVYAQKINDVPMEKVFIKSNPQPVKGVKTFKNLEVDELKVELINKDKPSKILSLFVPSAQSKINFDSNVVIDNLDVETIDGIDWNEFVNSVFRVGKDSELTGPLSFSKLKTLKLSLNKLKDVKVADFLTTSTDQTILSNLEFHSIFAKNISTGTVNNINLLETAVLIGQNNSINGPVSFEKLNVVKNLEIVGKVDESLFWRSGFHIIGTNESDLFQHYSGKVKLRRNLHLTNLYLQPTTKLVVSGNRMNVDIADAYWTKSTNQAIDVHLTALQGVSTPHVLTDTLNDIKFSQYMLNNNNEKLETDYHYETISVKGNVILRNTAQHQPNVNKIGKEAIKTNGSFIINGKKTYKDTLRTENLATLELDRIDTLEVLTTKWPANVTGTKFFKNLVVMGNMNSTLTEVEKINDIVIEDLMNGVIYIDQPQAINAMHFVNLNVTNLVVTKLNEHAIDEYVSSSKNLPSLFKRIDNLVIKGNFTVDNLKDLSTINDIPFIDLLNNAPKRGEFGGIIGDVRFSGKITVGNLATSFINGIDLENITRRFLFREYNQTITAPYSYGSIKSDNIITSKINNITMDSLIDVSNKTPQELNSPSKLRFKEAVLNSIEARSMSPCMLTDLVARMKNPPSKIWSEVQVKGNVSLFDNENVLYRILENSVKMNTKNVISSSVTFSGNIKAKNVAIRKSINNVNLAEILDDAVLTNSKSQQIITGQKRFSTIRAKIATVLQNADIRLINGEDIEHLNEDIVDKKRIDQVVIKGKKTFFAGLQTNRIQAETVSNLDPENLVQIGSTRKVPSAIFDYLDVENDLNITFFNNINFRDVLKNRLLSKGAEVQTVQGTLFFENLEARNLFTPIINKIKINNILFDEPNQTISSPKHFKKKVEIFGNITVDSINGVSISNEYKRSIMLGESVSVDGSVRVLRPSQITGNVATGSINGHSISEIEEILNKSNIKTEVQEIYDLKDRVIEQVHRNVRAVQAIPGEYLYLEKSDELQISVPNTVSASTVVSNGFVLFHVTGYASGGLCGLPDICQCPQQLTIEVSPEHSVTTFPNKGYQRSFSYDDESMTVYVTTNSVSTSSNCSTGSSKVMNEVSTLTWNTKSTSSTSGLFYQYDTFITGHISKVEFFTLENKTYVIIGRYYDPVLNNYDLDCTVIKFNENRTAASEIQKIPTKAVLELQLFHTAQGVVLIIGNTKSSHEHHEEDETQIWRFNPVNERFELLRKIPSFGCSDASGVVLGFDSFIVLAHKLAPIQVLKYYPDFDNYYAYQSIELEEPVIGITTFYIGGFGMSDAYLAIITDNENYFIYEFRFLEGWKMKSRGELEGLRNFVPFELNKKSYIFAPSSKISSLLTVVKNGSY